MKIKLSQYATRDGGASNVLRGAVAPSAPPPCADLSERFGSLNYIDLYNSNISDNNPILIGYSHIDFPSADVYSWGNACSIHY